MSQHKSRPFGDGSGLYGNGLFQVLRRFLALRGQLAVIISDNGSEFVGAEKELRQMVKSILEDKAATY